MKQRIIQCIVGIFILSCSTILMAATDIVDGGWLLKHAQDSNLVVIDIQSKDYYQRFHVPGAISAPYSIWRTGKKSQPVGMMPSIEKLSVLLGKLGVTQSNQVVIVATGNGAGEMAAAARVFWSFKVLGHKSVAILDGGLASYANDFKGPLSSVPVTIKKTRYEASPNQSIVADSGDVLKAIKSNQLLLDARSRGEYVGVVQGGINERPGTIPGSKNLPFDWMTVNQSANLHKNKAIKNLFNSIGADKNDGTIHFCHTGSRAALTWFVDYSILGHKNARLYDASMIEWAIDKTKPIEVKLSLTK